MKVINLFAGPGAGKSTTAAGVFHNLKLQGYNCELVTEYAKDLTWDERHNVLMYDQLYVTAKQNRRLVRINNKVDYAIVDSPLLLALIYREDTYLPKSFDIMIKELFDQYDNINFFIERKKEYNPVGRNQSEEEAKALDQLIKNMLEREGIFFTTIPGNQEAIDIIKQSL